MKVIFLDIDGVLNTPSSESRCGEYIGIDDEKVEKLKKSSKKRKRKSCLSPRGRSIGEKKRN